MLTSARSRLGLLLAPVLVLFATGYTNCNYFSKVTVPATDTGKPTTYDGVWVNGDYVEGAIPGQRFDYKITPGQTVLAVSSAIDPGGLRKLTMRSSFQYTCCNGSGICSTTQPSSVPQVEEQAGGVGASVSNGIWLGPDVTLPSCSSGFTLRSYRFSWFTEAEDFHGNRTIGSSQSISYP